MKIRLYIAKFLLFCYNRNDNNILEDEMLTVKENLLETMKKDGNPDRFVKQYEFLHFSKQIFENPQSEKTRAFLQTSLEEF